MGAEVPPQLVIRPPASKVPWVLGGVAVLVAAGAVAFAMRPREPAPVATPTPTAAPVPTDVPAGPELWQTKYGQVDAIDLTILVAPTNATIFLDGAQVSGNPYSAKYKKGGKHKIMATAPGYAPKTQESEFEANTQIVMSLDKSPTFANGVPTVGPGGAKTAATAQPSAAPTAPPSSAATTAPTPHSTEINPSGGTAPVHKIDPNNPYGN
jgi:hypothetical protein